LDAGPQRRDCRPRTRLDARNFAGRLFFTTENGPARLRLLLHPDPGAAAGVRRQDWREWLRYLLRLYSRKLGWAVSRWWERSDPPPADHDFPGNVRELEGLVDRALRPDAGFGPGVALSPWPAGRGLVSG